MNYDVKGNLRRVLSQLPPGVRLWICAILMMATLFFYGIHVTSTFDAGLVTHQERHVVGS